MAKPIAVIKLGGTIAVEPDRVIIGGRSAEWSEKDYRTYAKGLLDGHDASGIKGIAFWRPMTIFAVALLVAFVVVWLYKPFGWMQGWGTPTVIQQTVCKTW